MTGAHADLPARLAALAALGVMDTPAEPQFDDLVLLARQIAATPIALVSLVDHERQWFKARSGLDAVQTPRSEAFCAHAIQQSAVMVVPDATRDPRFADNPLVTGAPHIRFYAGAPIVVAGGHAIGTVCVIDTLPRADFLAAPALAALARQAASLLEYRREAAFRAAAGAEQQRLAGAMAQDLDQLWRLAHDLMIVTDLDARLLAVNPAWEALFGPLPASSVLTPGHFHHPDETTPLHTAETTREPQFFRRHYIDRTGRERFISWTLTRSGERMFGVGRDDTALLEAEESLRQSQKMEAVGQLTGGIAHDFNNLLTIVLGNLDMAARRIADGNTERAGRAIAHAHEGADRAATLTRRLLAFARRQPLSPRPSDPAQQIRLARDLVERAVGETVEVRIECANGCWPVLVDPVQLESALLNLAVNARDAMAGGGHLTLAAGNVRLEAAATVAPGSPPPGDWVRFTVADTGCGMAAETLARVFEPFFTTKDIGKGTGLGLSQVHGFVVQSGGAVTIDSDVGRGTAVHLWLPRSAEAPRETTMLPRQVARIPGGGARVLVVEDNDQLRELVVTTLRDDGYRVLEAHDGASGLALFQRQERAPEIVLTDIQMPNMDGLALAAAIRARVPTTRIVMMTGYADRIASAAAELIVKPFTPDQLLAKLGTSAG